MNTTYNFQNFHNFEQLEEGAFKVVTNNWETGNSVLDDYIDYSPQPKVHNFVTDENWNDSSSEKHKIKSYQSVNKEGRVRKKEVLTTQK